MAIIDLQADLPNKVAHENFWLTGDSVATVGMDGRAQVLFTENRIWVGQIDLASMVEGDTLAARSIGTRLRGRANLLRLTLCNFFTPTFGGDLGAFYASANVPQSDIDRGFIQFSDEARFDDGSGFALPDPSEPTVVADAVVGAMSIQLDGYIGRNASVGARFSINDFLYEIETNDDGAITFSPPLREAVAAGAVVAISNPTILVRLTTDQDWRPFTQYGRINKPMTVNVFEAFDR